MGICGAEGTDSDVSLKTPKNLMTEIGLPDVAQHDPIATATKVFTLLNTLVAVVTVFSAIADSLR